ESVADSLVPVHAAYAWNQALMDLGATLCRARQPMCLVCPLLGVCEGPTMFEPRRPAGEFRGSNRFLRGRAIDALRALPRGESVSMQDLTAASGAPEALIARLSNDGLVSVEGDQVSLRT